MSPAADLTRIDGMNPEKDKQAAQDNNFTIRYNVLDLDNKDAGSVEYQNLQRTIKQEKEGSRVLPRKPLQRRSPEEKRAPDSKGSLRAGKDEDGDCREKMAVRNHRTP